MKNDVPSVGTVFAFRTDYRYVEDTHSVKIKVHYYLLAVFVLFLWSPKAFADSTGTGRVTLTSLPDSARFYINGLERTPDENNGFDVPAGPVLFEIKQRRVVVFSTFFLLTATEEQKIPIDCAGTCALLHVRTEPPGAVLSINGTIVGTTPFLDRFIRPGELSIMVTRPGYIPVIRRSSLSTDSSEVQHFELEHTQGVKDSLAAVKRELRRKRQILQCSLFGGFGCLALIAGGYFDHKAYRHLEEAQKASDAYDAARSDAACQAARKEYASEREQAERPILYRNAFYGVVGACLTGFYLSIVF